MKKYGLFTYFINCSVLMTKILFHSVERLFYDHEVDVLSLI